jgi:mono/diheme cytochrome c family protein
MRLAGVLAVIVAIAPVAQAAAQEPELDPLTGLKMTGDWQLVRNNCVGCHSAKLITQQSGTESHWLGLIRWMQAKQNLWQFEPATEQKIIAYLAANYPPQEGRRRAPIPPDLMPPNPYVPSLQGEP